MSRDFLALQVSKCRHCSEPILRPVTASVDAGLRVRWLHTPERVGCVDALTREPTGTHAEPVVAVAA